MKVISVNVGEPREVEWRGRQIVTAIFKAPMEGRVRVGTVNLQGDRQADLSVHGGVNKAVYAYPAEHYSYWLGEYPNLDVQWGLFGENLTLEGILEQEACVGDVFRMGSAELGVTQPRLPCFKLGIRFGRPDIVKRFQAAGRPGFYLRVVREGTVEAGSELTLIHREAEALAISDLVALYQSKAPDRGLLERAVALPTLGPEWREHFLHQLG